MLVSGVLPVLALALRHRGALRPLTAKLVAELARERESSAVRPLARLWSDTHPLLCSLALLRRGFGDAGLVPAVLSLLTSADRELLLYAARAVSRLSQDSRKSPPGWNWVRVQRPAQGGRWFGLRVRG